MRPLSVLVAEHDPAVAQCLASSFDRYFRSVRMAKSADEVKQAIPRLRVDAVIANLEAIGLDDVAALTREFNLPIVCTHRLPDEELWTAAMDAGAIDFCQSGDVDAIITALSRHIGAARSTAA